MSEKTRRHKRTSAEVREEAAIERAYARFDGATDQAKIEWALRFARTTELGNSPTLGADLRAFARVVGIHFIWNVPARPLSRVEVRRIHSIVRAGFDALQKSQLAEVELRKSKGPAFSTSAGWLLPPHRIRLRRLPADTAQVNTSTIALYATGNEASAIVAAIGHFLLRHSLRWRWCACGCNETLVIDGKRKFLPKHQNRFWQKQHYRRRSLVET